MTRTGMFWILAAALAMGATATPARAQKLSEARIQELIKQAAAQLVRSDQTAQPPAAGAQAATRPTVGLTLDDAVKLALDRNLDIAVQRLNPQISDIAISSALSVYNPVANSTLNAQSTSTPPTSSLVGSSTVGAPVIAGLDTFNGGLTENVPWKGGSVNLSLINTRNTTTSLNTLYNPAFNTNWAATYTQPLMRNLATDTNRRLIQVSKINRDISDVQLRATIINTLSNVREAYWNYVYAVQALGVAQQSVDLAEQLVKDNQTRLEVGTMAPIDVVTAQSQAAAAKQNLVLAKGTRDSNEIALKRLIVGGTEDPNWNVHLDPTDRPEFGPVTIDIEAAVRRALAERTDLMVAQKDLDMNDVTLRYLKDQLKPQADLVGTYGIVGLGGTQLIKSNTTTVNQTSSGSIPGGYVDALNTMFGRGCPNSTSVATCFPRWTVQMNFSYPLGVSTQKASVARAQVQQNQVQAQVKQIQLQIATDVTNAAVSAQSNAERVAAAHAATELADQTMKAEQSKFEVGMSTNYNVILTQRDLATAQINELQAILNYRIALVELERLQQTTLQNLNVTILSTAAAGATVVSQ